MYYFLRRTHVISRSLVMVFFWALTGPYPTLRFGGACGLGWGRSNEVTFIYWESTHVILYENTCNHDVVHCSTEPPTPRCDISPVSIMAHAYS